MSAAAIFRQPCINGSTNRNELSESTVNRFLNNLALKEKTTDNQDMRRYERAHVNEVRCGDSSVGPCLKTADGKKHKVYAIAPIDDAGRTYRPYRTLTMASHIRQPRKPRWSVVSYHERPVDGRP